MPFVILRAMQSEGGRRWQQQQLSGCIEKARTQCTIWIECDPFRFLWANRYVTFFLFRAALNPAGLCRCRWHAVLPVTQPNVVRAFDWNDFSFFFRLCFPFAASNVIELFEWVHCFSTYAKSIQLYTCIMRTKPMAIDAEKIAIAMHHWPTVIAGWNG